MKTRSGAPRLKRLICAVTAAVTALAATSCAYLENTLEGERTTVNHRIPVSFSWWGTEIRSDYMIQGISEYEQKFSRIDIRPSISDHTGYKENLDALMAGGKEPDIMMIDASWLPEYSPDGLGFCNLRDYADEIDLTNFSEKELSYGTENGRLNALPVSLNAMSFYYNRMMLNNYELSVPETWDDLFSVADILSKDGIYTLESSNRHYFKLLTAYQEQQSGREAFGTEGFTSEDVCEMMKFYRKLIDRKVIPFKEYEKADFLSGKTVGVMLWVSDAEYYVSPLEDDGGEVIVGGYPHSEQNKRFGWYVQPTCLYAISRNSENQRESARFLNYLLNDSRMAELQGTENGTPLSRSALETLEAKNMLRGISYQASNMIKNNADNLELMSPKFEDIDRVNCFFEYFDLFYYGRMSAEKAADTFVRKYPFKGAGG